MRWRGRWRWHGRTLVVYRESLFCVTRSVQLTESIVITLPRGVQTEILLPRKVSIHAFDEVTGKANSTATVTTQLTRLRQSWDIGTFWGQAQDISGTSPYDSYNYAPTMPEGISGANRDILAPSDIWPSRPDVHWLPPINYITRVRCCIDRL